MKLYSFQPLFVYESLKELGYFHPFSLYEYDNFLRDEIAQEKHQWSFSNAYEWLKEQMNEQGKEYIANNSHMIWAWYQWEGDERVKPDKRYRSVFSYTKEPYVLMELDIDPKRICLSDYHAWHDVLNYHLLEKEEAIEVFENKYKQFNFYRDKPVADYNANFEMQESWKTIFNMEKSREILELSKKEQSIQATFFELFYTDVSKVHFFENKNCIKVEKIFHKIN